VKLAAAEQGGVEIINVVRRPEQADLLKELGAKHVVVTSEENWKETLQAKIQELGATVAFDAVAGIMSADILSCLPKGGTCFVYGVLAGKIQDINPADLIYSEKTLSGWILMAWINKGGMLYTIPRMLAANRKVNSGLHNGWSKTQFQDTTIENVQKDLVALLKDGATGKKLRVRF